MPRFQVAHVREQGIDLIIIPLDSGFGQKLSSEQNEITSGLQVRARGAGLAGTVVPVWNSGGGRMAFIAPPNWHSFFRGLSLNSIATNLNKEISW
jgi:hypothetical protein